MTGEPASPGPPDLPAVRLDVITVFPDYLAPLELSLIGRARRTGRLAVRAWDLRDYTHDRHRTVDDTPFGGGAGMVMRPEPWGEALDAVLADGLTDRRLASLSQQAGPVLVVPSPAGWPFTQQTARQLAECRWLVFACGRYEGIDERFIEDATSRLPVRVLSLGDYVLAGGEVAALAMIEAVTRLVPGVIGNPDSLREESHEDGLLEYPVYTKPAKWRGRDVPALLTCGDHGAIAAWRHRQRLERTAQRRPDLLRPRWDIGEDPTGVAAAVRLAQPADAPELLVLQRCCWAEEARRNDLWDVPVLTESLQDVREGLDSWRTFVVRHDNRLVGSIRGRLVGQAWQIERLMVAPDLRGHGLGRRLLAFIESMAPEQALNVHLRTGARSAGSLRMYQRAGYRPGPAGGATPGATELTKPLPIGPAF